MSLRPSGRTAKQHQIEILCDNSKASRHNNTEKMSEEVSAKNRRLNLNIERIVSMNENLRSVVSALQRKITINYN